MCGTLSCNQLNTGTENEVDFSERDTDADFSERDTKEQIEVHESNTDSNDVVAPAQLPTEISGVYLVGPLGLNQIDELIVGISVDCSLNPDQCNTSEHIDLLNKFKSGWNEDACKLKTENGTEYKLMQFPERTCIM